MICVYGLASLFFLSGALTIANAKMGGILLCLCSVIQILVKDNPWLQPTPFLYRVAFSNFLKDLAVAGAALLICTKRRVVHHRCDLEKKHQ